MYAARLSSGVPLFAGNDIFGVIMSHAIVRFLSVFLAFLPAVAGAAPTSVAIPGLGWQVSFDAPPAVERKESDHPDQYLYFASAGRFNMSIYVETPGCKRGATHADFRDCFWPKASRNPVIVKESIRQECGERYCKVSYDIEAPWDRRLVRQRNINFLFAYRGKWTDVHVSVLEPTEADVKMLEAFEASLGYDTLP